VDADLLVALPEIVERGWEAAGLAVVGYG